MRQYICVIFIVLNVYIHGLQEGDECTNFKMEGICVHIRDCSSANYEIRNRNHPKICSFRGKEPIVCCFDTTQKESVEKIRPTPAPIDNSISVTEKFEKEEDGAKAKDKEYDIEVLESDNPGDQCTKLGMIGNCVHIQNCVSANEEIRKGIYPKICSFIGNDPIVCCFSTTQKTESKEVQTTSVPIDCISVREKVDGNERQKDEAMVKKIEADLGCPPIPEKYTTKDNQLVPMEKTLSYTNTITWNHVSKVATGILKRSDIPTRASIFNVVDIVAHPGYKPPSKYNDIAVLKTEKMTLDVYHVPACLHIGQNLDTDHAVATGWGSIWDKGPTSDILQKGDSGGPLQIRHLDVHGMYLVIGVTSFGRRCGVINQPAVYTRVESYVPWIESIVWPH